MRTMLWLALLALTIQSPLPSPDQLSTVYVVGERDWRAHVEIRHRFVNAAGYHWRTPDGWHGVFFFPPWYESPLPTEEP